MSLRRVGTTVIGAALIAIAIRPAPAGAAAEVHRFNLVVTGIPGSIEVGGFQDSLRAYNILHPGKRGVVGLDSPDFGWQIEAQALYFLRPHLALNFGVGQLRAEHEREVLPRLLQVIQFRTEVLSVPVHAGVDYYFPAYVQGDFQARAYVGGGVLSLAYNRVRLQQFEAGTDSSTTFGDDRTPPESFRATFANDAPGYYLETGFHLWFPSRLSVVLGGYYRRAVIRNLRDHFTGDPIYFRGKALDLDLSGLGARFSLGIGL